MLVSFSIFSIDVTYNDCMLGRLVNDSPMPNCIMRRVTMKTGHPFLALLAAKEIEPGFNSLFTLKYTQLLSSFGW